MKKYFIIASIALLAASCAKPQPVSVAPTLIPGPSASPSPVQAAGWKTYKYNQYGFQFKYPEDYYLNTEIINDPEAAQLNENLSAQDSDEIRMFVIELKSFPENLSDACKAAGMPVSDGVKCLLTGSDAEIGSVQPYIVNENKALQAAKVGSIFSYFSYSPVESQPSPTGWSQITGTVVQAGSHKVYVYANIGSQEVGVYFNIVGFDSNGDIFHISFASQTFGFLSFDQAKKINATDIKTSPEWQTAQTIASSLQIN